MAGFDEDLDLIYKKLCEDLDTEEIRELERLRMKLLELYKRQLVKSNHSVMELIVAKQFLIRGWSVDLEYKLSKVLLCDVYCRNGDRRIIVEVETGFVPPENAIDPMAYRLVRITSKAARYSPFADEFYFATPAYHILQIPQLFLVPPSDRGEYSDELKGLKLLCDRYYKSPPISIEELRNARVDGVILLNVDDVDAYFMTLYDYYSLFLRSLVKLGMIIMPYLIFTEREN